MCVPMYMRPATSLTHMHGSKYLHLPHPRRWLERPDGGSTFLHGNKGKQTRYIGVSVGVGNKGKQ